MRNKLGIMCLLAGAMLLVQLVMACSEQVKLKAGPYNNSDAAPYTQYNAPHQYDPNVLIPGSVGQALQVGDGGTVKFGVFPNNMTYTAALGMISIDAAAKTIYIAPSPTVNKTLFTNDAGVVVWH